VTIPELIAIALLGVFILFLFYPKTKIEHMIANEKSNYDLTLIYLKSIAEAYPDDRSNWQRLIQAYLKAGKTEEAQKVYESYFVDQNSTDDMAALTAYRLLKAKYLKRQNSVEKVQMKLLIEKYLRELIATGRQSVWFLVLMDARSLDLPQIRLEVLQKMIKASKTPEIARLMEAYRLAAALDKKEIAIKLLQEGYEKTKNPKVAKELIRFYLANGMLQEAKRFSIRAMKDRGVF